MASITQEHKLGKHKDLQKVDIKHLQQHCVQWKSLDMHAL